MKKIGFKVKEHKVVMLDISKVKTDGENPNVMSDEQKEALHKSMEEFGYLAPIVVNEKYIIADGEHRLNAYKSYGKKKIPAFIVKFESDKHRKLFRQVANKLRGRHDTRLDVEEFKRIFENDEITQELFNTFSIMEGSTRKILQNLDKETDDILSALEKKRMNVLEIPIDKIVPNTFNPNEMSESSKTSLKKSILEIGLQHPIIVRPKGKGYEIIDGQNRVEIMRELGFSSVPCKVMDVDDITAKGISFSVNRIRGRFASNKSSKFVKEIRDKVGDEKAQKMLGLTKQHLDLYSKFEGQEFFEDGSGITLREYGEDDFEKIRPTFIVAFEDDKDFVFCKNVLISIDRKLHVALKKLCEKWK